MTKEFILNQQLANDTLFIKDLTLCRVLLMNNRHFPWLVLVPRLNNIHEVFELENDSQILLWQETSIVAERLKTYFKADKMNIATLGNVVSQLHIHIIARYKHDIGWPKPVWGLKSEPYSEQELENLINGVRHHVLNLTKARHK